jgi:hypothetical protein
MTPQLTDVYRRAVAGDDETFDSMIAAIDLTYFYERRSCQLTGSPNLGECMGTSRRSRQPDYSPLRDYT